MILNYPLNMKIINISLILINNLYNKNKIK